MLPEFLDDSGNYKLNIASPRLIDELEELKAWLAKKENESSRQIRPSWIEVSWALIALLEQQLEQLGAEEGKPEQFAFETHIIARQVAKQKQERQLPTRFVTDEIKRISNHQLSFLNEIDKNISIPVLGWYRFSNRRGLGIAIMSHTEALALCNNDSEPQESNSSQDNAEHNKLVVDSPLSKRFTLPTLTFIFGAILASIFHSSVDRASIPTNTLESVLTSNTLRCGVDGSLPHFSLYNDAEQTWWGLDVELCKALAAALDVNVEFVKVSESKFEKRIEALQNQRVHILFRNTSHTATWDLNSNIVFGPHYFYEQEYFLDFTANGSQTPLDLDGINKRNVCVKPGTSNEVTLQLLKSESDFNIVTQNKQGKALTDNIKLLRALRLDKTLCDFAFGNYFVLKQLKEDQERRNPEKTLALRAFSKISLDPLAPVLLSDQHWQTIVSYAIYALLYAEQLNINSYNVDNKHSSGNPIEQRFLRGEDWEKLGLSKDWVYRIISKVGNYSEVYYRSIVCDYVECKMPDEASFASAIKEIEKSRWPNKLFVERDPQPGLLTAPRF